MFREPYLVVAIREYVRKRLPAVRHEREGIRAQFELLEFLMFGTAPFLEVSEMIPVQAAGGGVGMSRSMLKS